MQPFFNSYNAEVAGSNFGAVSITTDNSLLAVGGSTDCDSGFGTNRGRIIVYNTSNFTVKGNVIRGDTDGQFIGKTVCISDDGTRVFSACDDLKSRVYLYNTLTSTWDLEYTTPPISFVADYGLSIRCNDTGTIFFVTAGDLGGSGNRRLFFYSYNGSNWALDGLRISPIPGGAGSYISDCDASMTTLIGTYGTAQPFTAYSWNGSSWVAKGSSFSGFTAMAVGMSPDGNTIAIFDSTINAIKVYDWSGSAWVNRANILVDAGTNINSRISISSDKNTISFTGTPATSDKFGVYTYSGGFFVQDRIYYNELVSHVNPNAVLYVRSQTMSNDLAVNVVAYRNNTTGFNGIAVFQAGSGPMAPLIVPVDDDFTSQSFNVHPNNSRLIPSPPFNVLLNDNYTAPQVADTGTVGSSDINPNAVLGTNGEFYITSTHPSGDYSFTYTVVDDNNTESDPATVSYTVVNYGITGNISVEDINVGSNIEILTAAEIFDLVSDSDDLSNIAVEISLVSGDSPPRMFMADDNLNYEVTLFSPGLQTVTVMFTYQGEQLSVSADFQVIDPIPNVPGDSVTMNTSVIRPTIVPVVTPIADGGAAGVSTTTVMTVAAVTVLILLLILFL